MTGESCQISLVDNLQSSPFLYASTCSNTFLGLSERVTRRRRASTSLPARAESSAYVPQCARTTPTRPHAFTTLGSGPTSGSGPISGSDPTFTASGFGPAFTALGFGPAFGFWPRIELRPHFKASVSHRASAPLLSFGPVSGLGPAFTAFGPRPSIYCFGVLAPHLLHSGFDTSHLLLSGSSEIQNRLGFKFIQAILRGASLIISLQRLEVTATQAEHDPTLDHRRYQHDHASDQRMDLIHLCCGRRLNTGATYAVFFKLSFTLI
ncbi:hypothetical protein CRG98_040389 [Punica granatum]|uniref:Uncharacterized protein n=1 Tax=Punica granatum TaxID=22663 RepID=A0A2I0I6C2_PUNGR|nr:hypothetical protein CRG98_040389 [Punica granatum]